MGTAGEGLRLTREWIQAGAIGPVRREIHCWSDRPGKWWTQDLDRPADTPPVPPQNWTGISGSAPHRCGRTIRFIARRCVAGLVRFRHRCLGDMAIHNMDPAFYALGSGQGAKAVGVTNAAR